MLHVPAARHRLCSCKTSMAAGFYWFCPKGLGTWGTRRIPQHGWVQPCLLLQQGGQGTGNRAVGSIWGLRGFSLAFELAFTKLRRLAAL